MFTDKFIYSQVSSKLLIAGGYSILYGQNVGLSLATDQQFYGTLLDIKQDKELKIIVDCKQISQKYVYKIDLESHDIEEQCGQNQFIYSSIKAVYWFAIQLGIQISNHTLNLNIFNDQHFYSSDSQLDQLSQTNHKFRKFKPLSHLKKTGLGSSSCVVSVVVDLLVQFYKIDQKYRYVISLVSNFSAQNKIGSGFDISTAIFGSQLFKRVDKQLIQTIYEQFFSVNNQLVNLIDQNLNQINNINQININPQNLNIYMLDIQQGSNTRIMVSKVMHHFQNNPQKLQYFTQQSNNHVSQILHCLQSQQYENLKTSCHKYRGLLKQLGNESGVEIEPDLYSQVFDSLLQNDGIYYCICPGAGGYDSAVIISSSSVNQNQLEQMVIDIDGHQKQILQLQLQEHNYSQQQKIQVLDYLLSQ